MTPTRSCELAIRRFRGRPSAACTTSCTSRGRLRRVRALTAGVIMLATIAARAQAPAPAADLQFLWGAGLSDHRWSRLVAKRWVRYRRPHRSHADAPAAAVPADDPDV